MVASPLCQAPSAGDCMPSLASKVISRLRSLDRRGEATEYYTDALAIRGADGRPLLQWQSEWQIPAWYIPGLTAKPWWQPSASEPPALVAVRATMAEHYTAMQADVVKLAARARRMQQASEEELFELQMDHELVSEGAWTEYILYDNGRWHEAHCEKLPSVCQAMSSLAAVAGDMQGFDDVPGQVTILRMDAGTSLGSHCGPTNSRLTAHLPLIVPPVAEQPLRNPFGGCGGVSRVVGLRVGEPAAFPYDDWRVWKEGQLMIFDDSFEHQAAWPEPVGEAASGGTARYVLYASLWHPDLGDPTLPDSRRWRKRKGRRRATQGKQKPKKKSDL